MASGLIVDTLQQFIGNEAVLWIEVLIDLQQNTTMISGKTALSYLVVKYENQKPRCIGVAAID